MIGESGQIGVVHCVRSGSWLPARVKPDYCRVHSRPGSDAPTSNQQTRFQALPADAPQPRSSTSSRIPTANTQSTNHHKPQPPHNLPLTHHMLVRSGTGLALTLPATINANWESDRDTCHRYRSLAFGERDDDAQGQCHHNYQITARVTSSSAISAPRKSLLCSAIFTGFIWHHQQHQQSFIRDLRETNPLAHRPHRH